MSYIPSDIVKEIIEDGKEGSRQKAERCNTVSTLCVKMVSLWGQDVLCVYVWHQPTWIVFLFGFFLFRVLFVLPQRKSSPFSFPGGENIQTQLLKEQLNILTLDPRNNLLACFWWWKSINKLSQSQTIHHRGTLNLLYFHVFGMSEGTQLTAGKTC